jgi:hypothetical protein
VIHIGKTGPDRIENIECPTNAPAGKTWMLMRPSLAVLIRCAKRSALD